MSSKSKLTPPWLLPILGIGLVSALIWQPLHAASCQGTVFQDLNNNGLMEACEPVLPNTSLFIRDNAEADAGGGGLFNPITNENGQYTSPSHNTGSHTLWPDIPVGWEQTAPVRGEEGMAFYDITIANSSDTVTIDFGLRDPNQPVRNCTICDIVTEIPTAQCEALISLYDSTGGNNWTNNTGWKQTNTPCSWYGVTCNSDGVTKIELGGNFLRGAMPNFSALPNLQILSLHSNGLTGTIPDFSGLPNLQQLSLDTNQLTGTIPNFSGLPNLQWLSFFNNELTGTIPNFSGLPNLQFLSLSSNQLTGAIPDFSTLTSLTSLEFTGNQVCQNPNVDYGDLDVSAFLNCNDPNYGLVLDMPFDGNAKDASGNGHDGTVNGATLATDRDGNADSAYAFDGQTSRIKLPYNILNGLDTFSLRFWTQTTDTGNNKHLVSVANSQQSNEFLLRHNAGKIGIQIKGIEQPIDTPKINDGEWHLVNVVRSSSTLEVFVDGSLVATKQDAPAGKLIVESSGFWLGGEQDCVGGCWNKTQQFSGIMDEVSLYNRALTASEIQSYYKATKAVSTGCNGDTKLPGNLCKGLVAHYPFDNNPKDASGNGNDGIVNGATLTTDRHGNADSAYEFDDDYIEVPDSNGLDFTNKFTIGVWVNPEVQSDDIPTNGGIIISKEASYEFALTAGNSKIRYALKNSPSNWKWINTGIVAPLNRWTFLTMSYDGSLFKLYKDGILEYQRSESGNISPTDAPLGVGARYGGPLIDFPSYWVSKFNGLIDDVSLYRRTLTDAEVQTLYNSTKPTTTGCNGDTQLDNNLCEGLVAYYPLDNNSNDASGNGNDGTEHNVNYATGVVGNALDLDGTGYIRKENFNFSAENLAVAFWAKADKIPDNTWGRNMFAIHSGGGGKNQGDKTVKMGITPDKRINPILTTEDGQDGWLIRTPTTTVDDPTQWHHYVFVRDAGELQKLYVDGVRVGAVIEKNLKTQFFVEKGLLDIGASNYYDGGWDVPYRQTKWEGMLDEMYLYNRALSDAEIETLYSQNQAVQSPTPISCTNVTNAEIPDNLQTGLFAYYPLDGHACDVSGNGNNNAVEYQTDFASGVAGQALQLDGSGYIQHRDFDFTAEDLTIALWAKASSKAERYLIALHSGGTGTGAGDQTVNLHTRGSGNAIRVFLTTQDGQSSDDQIVMPVGGSIEPDNWYHVALVRHAGGSQEIYIDGVRVTTANEQNVLSEFSIENGFLEIGAPNYYKGGWNSGRENAKWQGLLDEMYLYTRVLTDAEIQQLANPTRPVAHYCFDDPDNLANDCTGNEKHGRLAYTSGEYEAGVSGNAIRLDGIDDFVNISAVEPAFMRSAFTLIAWFKPDELKSKQVVIWFQDGQPSIGVADKTPYFGYKSNTSQPPNVIEEQTFASNEISIGEWNCAGYTYKASNDHTMRFFLNGANIGYRKLDSNFIPSSTGKGRIGRDDNVARSFNGLVDDVQIYNYALSDEDIQTLCPTPPVSELVLEDAEDGDTTNWSIYENQGGDAAVSTVFDEESNSQVIELSGSKWGAYKLSTADGNAFGNTTNPIAQWRMKKTEGYYHAIYWRVKTSGSVIYLAYRDHVSLGCHLSDDPEYAICGIDMSIHDGEWHTITRDLEADLKAADPSLELLEVEHFQIRVYAKGRMDDIKLMSRDAVNVRTITGKITENGQDISGVSFTNSGADCQESNSYGNFVCVVPEGWFGTLVPKKAGYLFEPFTRVYRALPGNSTGQNFTAKPIPTDDTQPIVHWTRDMHPVEGNGAVHLPYYFGEYVDEHYTVTVRAKPTTIKPINYLFHANDDRPGIVMDDQNRVRFAFTYNGTVEPRPISQTGSLRSEPLPLNEWVEVAATWDGTNYVAYVNGEQIGSATLPKFIKGNRVAIGWDGGTDRAFEGEIAEVKIYKRALTFKTDCHTVTEIPTAQCETLVALYDSTDGDNWTNNDGWKKTDTPCSWYGVTCTDGKVTKISLEKNQLTGTLPELSPLTSLMDLRLFSNQLTGSIPELSALTQLQILFLNNNQLSGPIPELSALTQLQRIYLALNKLSGNIPELTALTNLQELDLSYNQLTGSIPNLSQLANLQRLKVKNNQLSGEIPDLGSLAKLETFDLTGNENKFCRNPETDYTGHTEVEAFPFCGTQAPIAVIAEPIIKGNLASFDASGSNDPDPNGKITNYTWITSDGQVITSTDPTPSMTFSEPGEHTVTLILTDNTGRVSEPLVQAITIGTPEPKTEKESDSSSGEPEVPVGAQETGPFSLTVTKRGTGEGEFQSTSPDSLLDCDIDCNRASRDYAKDSDVILLATPAAGSVFSGWSGGCRDGDEEGVGTVTMTKNRYCTATFELDPAQQTLHRVRVTKIGDGIGSITVKQDGNVVISCSSDRACEEKYYAPGTELTLRARAGDNADFVGWGEDCSGNETPLTLIIEEATKCTAEFALRPPLPTEYRLTVKVIPETTSEGKVTSGRGIECYKDGGDCVENYLAGETVRLIPIEEPHSRFKQWAGDCSGTRTTTVMMDSDKTCRAIFVSDSDILAVKRVEQFQDEGYLEGMDKKLTDMYRPIDNSACLQEAFRLSENVLFKVEEHLLLTGSWPHHFHRKEWYKPLPSNLCTKSIQIISEGTDILLAHGKEFVVGDYIKVEVELLNYEGVKEIVPILVYYGDNKPESTSRTRYWRSGGYCCWRRW